MKNQIEDLLPPNRQERNRHLCTKHLLPFATMALILLATAAAASHAPDERLFDARAARWGSDPLSTPPAARLAALDELRAAVGELITTHDPSSGATRSIYNPRGYLSGPVRGRKPKDIALDFIGRHRVALGVSHDDLDQLEVTDEVFSAATGATHLYLRQRHQGLAVYNAQLQAHINRDGKILSVNNTFAPGIERWAHAPSSMLAAEEAVGRAALHLGQPLASTPRRLGAPQGTAIRTELTAPDLSLEPITAELMWLPVGPREVRKVWRFQIHTLDSAHAYDFTVDAENGKVWTRGDWTMDASYSAYPPSAESPDHASPLPPGDGRLLLTDPQDPIASPFGWHDTDGAPGAEHSGLRGNNVHAYDDSDGSNSPPPVEPDCDAGLSCDFPLDLAQDPAAYTAAATTNLFFWTNYIHDVQYKYGFDEAAGNFQSHNYGRGGAGSDALRAEAQDGGGSNNANITVPPDGQPPRMQMYPWTYTSPARDGDLDNGIIVHEYGHGISVRQVGGPSNSTCLFNHQQPGEGWSDWLALVYTAQEGDRGPDPRGIGNYALGLPTDGPGIRRQPYTTDPTRNTHDYESIDGAARPHGVGEIWAQALWEVYWALVERHGFDPDLHAAQGGAGNQRAMLYVNEGFKNTVCSPTFVDTRDAIIQAAIDSYEGEDVCLLWEAFAAFGLGLDAVSGGPYSTQPTNGFTVPLHCSCQPAPVANAGPSRAICAGETVTLGTPSVAGTDYQWLPSGETTAQITVSPTATTTYTLTATTPECGSLSDNATVMVDDGGGAGLEEDFEGDLSAWSATGLWHAAQNSGCLTTPFSSPITSMYFGDETTCSFLQSMPHEGELISPPISGISAESELSFDYYFSAAAYFYAMSQVDVLTDSGSSTLYVPRQFEAWANSGPLSLEAFAGETIRLRFYFYTPVTHSGLGADQGYGPAQGLGEGQGAANDWYVGWFLDNVEVTPTGYCDTPPAGQVDILSPTNGDGFDLGDLVPLAATAWSGADGDISAQVLWRSDLDGDLGQGDNLDVSLSAGLHLLTASVTDSAGQTASDTVSVDVRSPDTPPVLQILAPQDSSAIDMGSMTTLQGTADDSQDGDLSPQILWSSSLDGGLGQGANLNVMLSLGSHLLTATVTDSAGQTTSDSVSIVVEAGDAAPALTIDAPGNGTTVDEGTGLDLLANAQDDIDGDLSPQILWSSNLDGSLGQGDQLGVILSPGDHLLTATVSDSAGQTTSAEVSVTVQVPSEPVTRVFRSIAAHDGRILESSEHSNVGGKAYPTSTDLKAIRMGDNRSDKQYKGLVSFDTSAIPEGAEILSATLRLRRGYVRGTNPFVTHGRCWVDMRSGPFSDQPALEAGDFQAPETVRQAAQLSNAPTNGEHSIAYLRDIGLAAIATDGLTQMRLYFELDDDDDRIFDYVGYYSGESSDPANHPELEVVYRE